MIFVTAPFEAEIARFSDQSQSQKKFKCKMADNHREQSVFGL